MKKLVLLFSMCLSALALSAQVIAGNGTGSNGWCCGYNWSTDGCNMSDNGDGTYTYSATVESGTYEFKVVYEGSWLNNVDEYASTSGYSNSDNVQFSVSETADITVTFNTATKVITLVSNVPFVTQGTTEIEKWSLVGAIPFFEGGGLEFLRC